MPILGREVNSQIDRRKPDRTGEEGVLFRVQTADNNYIAKQWYGMNEKRLTHYSEEESSPCSPYWHKVKFYEYKLIHAAFPDNTLEMVATFDERITKQPDGTYDFNFSTGRPTTVSKEVVGDPDLMQQRDAIVKPVYDHMLGYHDTTRHGHYATAEQRAEFYRVIAVADEELRELFGGSQMQAYLMSKPGQLPEGDIMINMRSINNLLQQGMIADTDNEMTNFLKSGILPIHPELNYIPEGMNELSGDTHGTYIELGIFNPEAFWSTWRKNHSAEDSKKVFSHLERFQMFKILDDMFDKMTHRAYENNNGLQYEDEIQTRFFRILEALRVHCEKISPQILQQLYDQVIQAVEDVFEQSANQKILIRNLDELHLRVTNIRTESED